jgi:hypothetical protein
MPILRFTAEELRDPFKSAVTVVRTEDAEDCYGDVCGQYYEHEGSALKPQAHSHFVVTGHDPETTSRAWPISK